MHVLGVWAVSLKQLVCETASNPSHSSECDLLMLNPFSTLHTFLNCGCINYTKLALVAHHLKRISTSHQSFLAFLSQGNGSVQSGACVLMELSITDVVFADIRSTEVGCSELVGE